MDGGTTESTGDGRRTIVEDLGDLERWWNASGIALWGFVLFGAFLLNATLLLAFVKRPGLRTISNRFVMNLTVSNLLTCAVLNPLLMLDGFSPSTNGESASGPSAVARTIVESATALVTSSSMMSVLLIAIDQYFAVVDPLRYRARIGKPRCAVLVTSAWLVSLTFAILAAFDPSPRSLWLLGNELGNATSNGENLRINEGFPPMGNRTAIASNLSPAINGTKKSSDSFAEFAIAEIEEHFLPLNDSETVELVEETLVRDFTTLTTTNASELSLPPPPPKMATTSILTYSLVYAIAYTLLAYLAPFLGVCWIYASIYTAAHENSERARRTGSRPALSSASLSEEYRPMRQDGTHPGDDFRRMPKISSLSSIDESIETHSPRGGAASQNPTDLTTSGSGGGGGNNNNNKNKKNKNVGPDSSAGTRSGDLEIGGVLFVLGSGKVGGNVVAPRHSARGDSAKGRHAIESTGAENPSSDDDAVEEEEEEEEDEDEEEEDEDEEGEREEEDDEDDDRNEPIGRVVEGEKVKEGHHRSTIRDARRRQQRRRRRRESWRPVGDPNVIATGAREYLEEPQTREGPNDSPPIVTITPPSGGSSLRRVSSSRSSTSYINSLKHRISNGSLFKYREETRAARISALVIVMGLVCWTPHVLVLLLRSAIDRNERTNGEIPWIHDRRFDILALGFVALATYLSPLLFGYRSRRVKRELRKFFCFRRELSYRNNRSLMAKNVMRRRRSANVVVVGAGCGGGVVAGGGVGGGAGSGGGIHNLEMGARCNIFDCVYGRSRWHKDKVRFVQVPDTALVVETCRSSFSSGASTQISSASTDDC